MLIRCGINLFLLFVQNVNSFLLVVAADLWQAASLGSHSRFYYWWCSVVIGWTAVLIPLVDAIRLIMDSLSIIVVIAVVIVHVAYLDIFHAQSLSQRICGFFLFIWALCWMQINHTIRLFMSIIGITPIQMFLILHDVIQPRRVPFLTLCIISIATEVLIIALHRLLMNAQVWLTCLYTLILSRSHT